MPELPEVAALTGLLDARLAGRRVDRCELASFSALKTVSPPLSDLVGATGQGCERRGKYLCLHFDGGTSGDCWLVVHLARGGWVMWYDALPATRPRPGRGPLALRLGINDGSGFDLTEAGTEKRLALWVATSPDDVEPVATLGVDPLDPGFTVTVLAELLAGTSSNVKTALTSQSLIAGVGNAYSDEALHAAGLSPYKRASGLGPDEVARLHRELVAVLAGAAARATELGAAELKGDKKRGLRVHGRTGEPCPVCGDTIRQVSFATKSMQYCPTCQTGGKPLADRRLSRLLK